MNALSHLAEKLGIARDYTDAFGKLRQVPGETLKSVFETLGFPADDESGAETALALLGISEAVEWAPPVVARRTNDGVIDIPIQGSGIDPSTIVVWELQLESGDRHEGRWTWDELARGSDKADAQRHLRLEYLPHGYHSVRIRLLGPYHREAETKLIVAPPTAYQPPSVAQGHRAWALTTQLYSLQSHHDWGIGDFSALGDLMERAAGLGAGAVGINPLHALFPDDPEQASPYSPASRLFLNPLYLDIEAMRDFKHSTEARALVAAPAFQENLAALRGKPHVDYTGVQMLKDDVLRTIYADFRKRCLDIPELGVEAADAADDGARAHAAAFRGFQAEHHDALRFFAVFATLRAEFGDRDITHRDWRHWPAEYRNPHSSAVTAYADQHVADVEYHEYLQWQAAVQLEAATARADMPIGLYGDLAIGIDSAGPDAWMQQDILAQGFSVGAPPDPLALDGQNWGFPPFNPRRIRDSAYSLFIKTIRANMRHAGALRIDHVLGFMRMFWIPAGRPNADGVYVTSPVDDLLAIVTLESHRARCLVIGEDLGTLPPGLRETLMDAGLFSYRLVFFEQMHGLFNAPSRYPQLAAAALSTHDLPTFAGFWRGDDIALRRRLGLIDDAVQADARKERERERAALIAAMWAEGIGGLDEDPPIVAVHRFLARTRARLALVQIDDVIGETEQTNVPGTNRENPNWRRRYRDRVDALFAHPLAQRVLDALKSERPLA